MLFYPVTLNEQKHYFTVPTSDYSFGVTTTWELGNFTWQKKKSCSKLYFQKGFPMDYCPSLCILDVYLKSSVFNWWHVSNSLKILFYFFFFTPQNYKSQLANCVAKFSHELLSYGQVFALWGHRDLDLDHQSLISSSMSPRGTFAPILKKFP